MHATTWTVRPATLDDVPRAVELRDDAARWLLARGVRQWQPGERTPAYFEAGIAAGHLHVALDPADSVVGTVLVQPSDEAIWGPDAGDAGYVHALVTARGDAYRGLGTHLLGWAEQRILAGGGRVARLDHVESNLRLGQVYEQLGYVVVGSTSFGEPVPHRATLREKVLR